MDKSLDKYAQDPSLIFNGWGKWFKIARWAFSEAVIALALYKSVCAGEFGTTACFAVSFIIMFFALAMIIHEDS